MANADKAVFLWINSLAGQVALLDRIVSWLSSDYLIPVSLSLTLVAMWFIGTDSEARKRHQIGLFVALTSMAVSSLVVFIINAFYSRPRPYEVLPEVTLLFYRPTDPSFPANSAAAAFGLSAAVWSVNRPVGNAMFVASGVYGLARVFAGVHYPLDIIGGALIGVGVAYIVIRVRDLLWPILNAVIKAARILCLA